MRTREEIERGIDEDVNDAMTSAGLTSRHLGMALEILLDIRDLLATPLKEEPK